MNGTDDLVGDNVEIIRLNLLGGIGWRAAREYGVTLVLFTILLDDSGKILLRHSGLPKPRMIIETIQGGEMNNPAQASVETGK